MELLVIVLYFFYPLHAVQVLHFRLGKSSFVFLIAEFLNQCFQTLDIFLLADIGCLLAFLIILLLFHI